MLQQCHMLPERHFGWPCQCARFTWASGAPWLWLCQVGAPWPLLGWVLTFPFLLVPLNSCCGITFYTVFAFQHSLKVRFVRVQV